MGISTSVPGNCQRKTLNVLLPLCKTLVNTKSPTGSSTDKRTAETVNSHKFFLTSLRRNSELTVVFVTTGVSVSEVNIPRPLVDEDALLVYQRRSKCISLQCLLFSCSTDLSIQRMLVPK